MTIKTYRNVDTRIPQSEPLDEKQVQNSAGGYTWQVDPWQRLERFLVLGSEGGTYYISEQKLTRDNAKNVLALIAQDGKRVVDMVVAISQAGRAPKNDPALFVLAACAKLGNEETRRYANSKLSDVARTGTHLLHYASFIEVFGGWGRGTVRAFQNWFLDKTPDQVAYQAVKYANRDGWTMRDILRLTHPKPADLVLESTFKYIVDDGAVTYNAPRILRGTELIKQGEVNAKTAAKYIRDYNLPREVVPTHLLNDKEVWQALLDTGMGITAMVRNLGKMSAVGLLSSNLDAATKQVIDVLSDVDVIAKSRIHPLQLLVAQRVYAQGRGDKGSLVWNPVQKIIDVLDEVFYASFKTVEPTGKNLLLAIDVSGSMAGRMGTLPISYAEAAATMALVTANVEENYEIMGFADNFVRLPISPKMRLTEATREVQKRNFGSTDCALPMIYAQSNDLQVDGFIVYTDNETWCGRVHPKVALQDYRNKTNRNAKSVVVGMAANNFTIADPEDSGMLDVVGFDTSTPAVIADFIRG